ncbi:hypothetical protein V1224_11710 [Lachnospiraceae bacterium JLR.KK008]
MKKVILTALVILAALQAPMVVMAHHGRGHGHGCGYYRTQAAPAYARCEVEGCSIAGIHEHDGVYYCAHTVGDGHCHAVCNVAGCTEITEHVHDGYVCLPHSAYEGCCAYHWQ